MTNERKLELTLCGMLPYGLQMMVGENDDREGSFTTLNGYYFTQKNVLTLQTPIGSFYEHELKPLLHSLDKLTEPILEGGLIPIVELFRLVFGGFGGYTISQPARMIRIEDSTNKLEMNIGVGYDKELCFWISSINQEGNDWNPSHNQLQLFEKLKEWHFNIYDLPSEMYIEKSLTT